MGEDCVTTGANCATKRNSDSTEDVLQNDKSTQSTWRTWFSEQKRILFHLIFPLKYSGLCTDLDNPCRSPRQSLCLSQYKGFLMVDTAGCMCCLKGLRGRDSVAAGKGAHQFYTSITVIYWRCMCMQNYNRAHFFKSYRGLPFWHDCEISSQKFQ